MIDYYKYLPQSKENEKWGLCVLHAGFHRIKPEEDYPTLNHPSHHYFNWERGRELNNEFQILYITKGEGVFESSSCELTNFQAGTIIVLFPNEWHRYKPKSKTGWDEYWVGFKGSFMENIVRNEYFPLDSPCIEVGFKEEIINIFIEIIDKIKAERTGYQPLISGAVSYLLGTIYSLSKQDALKEDSIEQIVNKARAILRSNIESTISGEQIAKELNVGYSWFRKVFKAYTGMGPGQYHIQLKIERAKQMLSDPTRSIKTIAYDLHFESSVYFSRLFREKTGLNPDRYRQQYYRK